MTPTADVEAALTADAQARAIWDRLAPSHRREYLTWIDEAKRPATRLRRIERTLTMLRERG